MGVCNPDWQNTDLSKMFDNPQSPSNNRRGPAAFRSQAMTLGQVQAKTRNKPLIEASDLNSLRLRPNAQVSSSSKLISDMLPGKTGSAELLCKRIEVGRKI